MILDVSVQAQLVADIESLNDIHDHIKALHGQIAKTIMKNEYKLIDRNCWVLGLRLIQRMKRVEAMNDQKRDTLNKIKKLISSQTAI